MHVSSLTDREHKSLSVLELSLPVAMGYVPLGAVFGFLFVHSGGAWWLAPLASLLVFAGAAQFMVIPMLVSGASLGAIALATAIINLRHVFYGLSLLGALPANVFARLYMVWTLTDENYSVLTTMQEDVGDSQRLVVMALNHGWWIAGTLLGALLGLQLPLALTGIEFSLTALFAVLAIEQWRKNRRIAPFVVAFAAYTAAAILVPQQSLLVALALCMLVGLLLSRFNRKELCA